MKSEICSAFSERKIELSAALSLEMRTAIADLGGPRCDGDTRERVIDRAARRAGISFRTAKALFYGEMTNPRATTVERVRAALSRRATNREEHARATAERAITELSSAIAGAILSGEDVDGDALVRMLNGLGAAGLSYRAMVEARAPSESA